MRSTTAGSPERGEQGQKLGPKISQPDPKLVPKPGAEEFDNCWVPRMGKQGQGPNPEREPVPNEVPTAKGETLISISDEPSPSSDDGFRKSKRRRRSPGPQQEEEPAWMAC